jgi:PAS domain S-box-containing protein
MTLDTRKKLSLLFIPVFIVLIAVLLVLNIGISFNPPILLLLFNTLFLGLIPIYVAYIAYVSFRGSGSPGLLLKGTGMLFLGLGAIGAGIAGFLPDSMNANVTIHNTSFCIGAFLQLVGILMVMSGTVPKQRLSTTREIVLIYGGCCVLLTVFFIAAMLGILPPFFIPGTGFTFLREFIIINAIEFFVFSAGILFYLYSKTRQEFFFWYSIGLALIAIGLVAVHFPSVLGSLLGWTGRSAQYLGAVYVLVAFNTLNRSAEETGIPLGEMLARFFGESEGSYKSLVETATDAIVVHDSMHRIIIWNRAAEEMFGYSQSEALGSSFIQLVIPDEFTEVIRDRLTDTSPSGGAVREHKPVEISVRRKDGGVFPVELSLSRHRVAESWVSTCIMRDLTERKAAEEHIRNLLSEVQYEKDRLSSLINSISDEIWFADTSKKFTIANPSALKEFGLDSETTDIEKFAASLEVYRPDGSTRPVEEAPPLRALQGEVVTNQEEMIRIPGRGGLRYRQVSANPVRDPSGNIIGSVSVVRDITGRKKMEEELREAHRRTTAILEGITDTFYSLDTRWRFTIVNPAAEKAPFGRPAHELLGRVIWELYPDLVGTRIHRHYLDALEKHTIEHYEAQSPLNRRWYEVFMQGQESGVDVYMRDITKRKRAEEELTQKHEDLQAAYEEIASTQEELRQNVKELSLREQELVKIEANLRDALAEKEILLSEIHHRVKNNLTAFISLLSLDGSYEDSEGGRALRKDLQNRARSMALIHETLYRTGKFSNVDMEIYLRTLVGQIAGSYAENTKIRTMVDAHEVTLDLARATTSGLIINELVTNSFKYAFPPGFDCMAVRGEPCSIRISLTSEEGICVLTVADNGRGLPDGFDPLTTKSLGLKLVTFLARHQLRAEIGVYSTRGTEFRFTMKNAGDYA